MARLITLLPCEKVIVGRDDLPTLIALFEYLNIEPSAGQDIAAVPPETITFQRWAVFSEWEIEESEVALKEADQILELQFPDGTVAPLRGKTPFRWQMAGTVRNHQEVYGFPVGQEGWYTIRVWLEKDGKPISPIGTRKMRVMHKLPSDQKPSPVLGISTTN